MAGADIDAGAGWWCWLACRASIMGMGGPGAKAPGRATGIQESGIMRRRGAGEGHARSDIFCDIFQGWGMLATAA